MELIIDDQPKESVIDAPDPLWKRVKDYIIDQILADPKLTQKYYDLHYKNTGSHGQATASK